MQVVIEKDHKINILQHDKAARCSRHTESFFVQHLSEYETLDYDRKVNRRILPDADTRDMMNNASIWPFEWPIRTYSPLFT